VRNEKRRQFVLRLRYMILVDVVCVLVAVLASYVIRYEALVRVWPYVRRNWMLFALAPIVRVGIYAGFRLYRRVWRYASVNELKAMILASGVASAIIWASDLWLFPAIDPGHLTSRSVLMLETIMSTGALGATRLLYRLTQRRMTNLDAARLRAFVEKPTRVLIAGAGDAGVMILREIQDNPHLGMKVVGFMDDDADKQGMTAHGARVLGSRHDLPDLVRRYGLEQVIIAMPTAPGKAIREIRSICRSAGVDVQVVPGVYELIGGQVSVNQVREVRIEDLLRRDPVQTDTRQVSSLLRGRRVLVTGAGGSIGSEICRQVARCEPAALILLGHGENSIFRIANELSRAHPRLAAFSVIADIRDRSRLRTVFADHRPEMVFHAAAHKHVPLMEENPTDAVTNNVLGTRNVVETAEENGVEHLVLISTDKAVNPTSVMGATKRVAELLVQQAARRSGRRYVAVRFGNVLGSRGSVVPLFQEQIARGGPVIVTDPKVKRYFMTIPEAVQLVLQAATLGDGGEVFVLDMGEPVAILDLARDMIALSGLQEGRDIDIEFSGLRPGEKMFEELFGPDENYSRTEHERIFMCGGASGPQPDSGSGREAAHVDMLIAAARACDAERTTELLRIVVPEYEPYGLPAQRSGDAEEGEGGALRSLSAHATG